MKPIIFVLCFVLMLSCKKEEIQKAVLIKYELTDDVSPLKVKLSVEGDFHWSEWMFDEETILTAQTGIIMEEVNISFRMRAQGLFNSQPLIKITKSILDKSQSKFRRLPPRLS